MKQTSGPAKKLADAVIKDIRRATAKTRSPEQSYTLAMARRLARYPGLHPADAEIRSWHDLVAASDLVRTLLGISPSVWRR